MYRFMSRFELAYQKAYEVLDSMSHQFKMVVSTTDVLKTVEKLKNIDIKYAEFDFAKLDDDSSKERYSRYGAAMYVSPEGENREAQILLNSRETIEMQRFSLVHELGHLMLDNMYQNDDGFLFSTHIDMDITSISDSDMEGNDFLIGEQAANIFALLVLIPDALLLKAIKIYDSLDEIAKAFGVEKSAVVSRIMLGIKREA